MIDSVIKEAAAKGVTLQVSDELITKLAQAGYDPLYGARPLRHLIQDKIENALAKQLLSGSVKKGATIQLNSQNVPL
jgi:ATP-dependent Clp protease ATP-binding subunit ClpB